MRFLLNGIVRKKLPKPLVRESVSGVSTAWGQQCSEKCGCVVRFECNMDKNNEIVSSHYQARRVLASIDGNKQLQPILTNSKSPQILVKPCSCDTLHSLSKHISSYIKNQSLTDIQNMAQFPRSSKEFRQTVLHVNNLENNHCFDVVEEAFYGMVHGYIPKPRKQSNYTSLNKYNTQRCVAEATDWEEYVDNQQNGLDAA